MDLPNNQQEYSEDVTFFMQTSSGFMSRIKTNNNTNTQHNRLLCIIIASIVSAVFLTNANVHAQGVETIASGVIDFLLTNPKTANITKPDELAALNVIRNLLSISAQRKHDINVAETGRTEITLNTTENEQTKIYQDNQGNIYVLYKDIIYPISSQIIEQAESELSVSRINNRTLQGYNLTQLKNEYRFTPVVYTYYTLFYFELVTIFTCNWAKDYDGQGLEFDEFNGIKRSFYEEESITLVMGCTSRYEIDWELNVYEALTGNCVYTREGNISKGANIICNKLDENLPIGVYIYTYNITCEQETNKNIIKTEKFEIIRHN